MGLGPAAGRLPMPPPERRTAGICVAPGAGGRHPLTRRWRSVGLWPRLTGRRCAGSRHGMGGNPSRNAVGGAHQDHGSAPGRTPGDAEPQSARRERRRHHAPTPQLDRPESIPDEVSPPLPHRRAKTHEAERPVADLPCAVEAEVVHVSHAVHGRARRHRRRPRSMGPHGRSRLLPRAGVAVHQDAYVGTAVAVRQLKGAPGQLEPHHRGDSHAGLYGRGHPGVPRHRTTAPEVAAVPGGAPSIPCHSPRMRRRSFHPSRRASAHGASSAAGCAQRYEQ